MKVDLYYLLYRHTTENLVGLKNGGMVTLLKLSSIDLNMSNNKLLAPIWTAKNAILGSTI